MVQVEFTEEIVEKMIVDMSSQSPPHHFEFDDPFWILITTILSHRTKDEVTDAAARRLFERYVTCENLSNAKYEDVLQIIDKVGFKTVKASRVIDTAKLILEKFGGSTPQTIEDLTSIKGVGRKTANVVLSDGFKIPSIAVDTHVLRISNRLGWAHSDNPDKTEIELRNLIPERFWLGLNPMMVEFGKKICRPIGPKCSECKISEFCHFYNKNK